MGPGDNLLDVDGLSELRRSARRITAGLTQLNDPAARVAGWDRVRAVQVTMDGAGRVVDAEVSLGWRDALRSAQFGAAVLEAANAADVGRWDAWTRAAQATSDDTGDPHPDADGWRVPAGIDPFRSLRDLDVQASTRELYYLAMEAIDRIHEAGRAADQSAVDNATAGRIQAHSPDRQVTVTLEAGRLVAVDVVQEWLRKATAAEIAQHLRAAFHAAQPSSQPSAVAAALDHPSIREIQRVSADPRELMRRLGFA